MAVIKADIFQAAQVSAMMSNNMDMMQVRAGQERMLNMLSGSVADESFKLAIRENISFLESNEALILSHKISNTTKTILTTNTFIPLDLDTLEVTSNITKSFIVSHPFIYENVNEGIVESWESDIGVIKMESLRENRDYNRIMEGIHKNKYEDNNMMVKSFKTFERSKDIDFKLNGIDKLEAVKMYETLDDLFNRGVDFIEY